MGISLATVAEVASVAGAGIAAVGAIQQGNAASQAAAYNAQVAANNAKIATQNAALIGAEGENNVAQAQSATRAKVGGIIASQAASGVDVNSGSAVDVRSSAAELGELNAINIRANAAREAYGQQTQSASFTGQSALDRAQSANDTTAGDLKAGGTLLSGFGNAWTQYSTPKTTFDTTDITQGGTNYTNSFSAAEA